MHEVAKTDINPQTGRAYAINPASGQWDDNYWATQVDPVVNKDFKVWQQNQQQANAAQDAYKQATTQAIGGLQQRQKDLPGQYADLLATVKGQYQPLIDTATASSGAELSRRGLTPDSALYQKETQGYLAPIYGQEAGNAQQIGAGSIADMTALAGNIAALQSGAAGTAAQLPLQFGQLSLQTQSLPSQIALAMANANAANAQARYVPIPNVGVYDLNTGQIVGGGLGASNQALSGVGGLFKYVP